MYSFLPDELLKEILAPALQVPDDSFTCIRGRSPFSNYNPTTSGYLLVCKDWLRVATPLLYNVVVLRSKAQIQALESTLVTTPELAVFIKKLRIESGYCSSLLKILKATNNLTDLCVSLEAYSSDNVNAFIKGLSFIRPRRLIIYDMARYGRKPVNQKVQTLRGALQQYIPKWENLVDITLPGAWRPWYSHAIPNPENFLEAVCKSTSIEIISMNKLDYFPSWLKEMATAPNLKKIRILSSGPQPRFDTALTTGIANNPRLKSLVEMHYDQPIILNNMTKPVTESPSPHALLEEAPTTAKGIATFPNQVWNNIMVYALGIPELEVVDTYKFPFHERSDLLNDWIPCGRGLALVCKKFHELSVPLFYRCLVVKDVRELQYVLSLFSQNKDAGKRVKTLITLNKRPDNPFIDHFCQLLASTPNLRRVSSLLSVSFSKGHFNDFTNDLFDWQCLTTLAQTAGPYLHDLRINLRRPSQPKSPDVFHQFTALKHLELESSAVFTFEPSKADRGVFSELESLSCRMSSNSFLLLLSAMDLPKLHTAKFPSMERCEGAITLLRNHGHKLRFLECGFLPGICVFDACPRLAVFEITSEKPGFPAAEFFFSNKEHPLETLRIKYSSSSADVKEKFKYLGSLDLTKFTSLHELVVHRCFWPTTENEIKKSYWVVWAERLQELYDINLVDSKGQKWIPRLRARKQPR